MDFNKSLQNYVLIINKTLTKYDENGPEFEYNGPVCGTVLCIDKKHGTHNLSTFFVLYCIFMYVIRMLA